MYSRVTLLLFLFSFLSLGNLDAKIVIVGCDSSSSDEFNFVSDIAIAAGTVIYFSEEHYDVANNQFGNVEGTISYTVPSGGLPAGKVVVILDQNSLGISADDGGAVVIVAGNWALSGTLEEITAFTASNPASPLNTITSVFCWFILEGGAGVGSNEDPSLDYPNCIVQDWSGQLDRGQYTRDRSLTTTLTDIQDITNWSFAAATTTMNSTNFTGTFSLDLALPVDLSNFEANRREASVQLLWETQSEINNQGFEIQHSTNASVWNKIDFINGNGNSNLRNSYYSIDNNPIEGLNYYRLKQFDSDGEFEYSDILSVEYKSFEKLLNLTIFPNPVIGKQVNVVFPEGKNSDMVSFRLFSAEGKIIKQWQKDNNQNVVLELDEISNGIYFLEIKSDNDIWRERLILSSK